MYRASGSGPWSRTYTRFVVARGQLGPASAVTTQAAPWRSSSAYTSARPTMGVAARRQPAMFSADNPGNGRAAHRPTLFVVRLHEQHTGTVTQQLPAAFESDRPRLRRGQPAEMSQPTVCLHRHGEAVRQPFPPAGKHGLGRPPVKAGVEFDGVEHLDVASQPPGDRQSQPVRHATPMVGGSAGGADPHAHGRQPVSCRRTSSLSDVRTRAAASRALAVGAIAPSVFGSAGSPSALAAVLARLSK